MRERRRHGKKRGTMRICGRHWISGEAECEERRRAEFEKVGWREGSRSICLVSKKEADTDL